MTDTISLDRYALAFDAAGRGWGRAATLALTGALAARGGRRNLAAYAAAQVATPAAVNLVKVVVRRERPVVARIDAWGSSFPSGHASFAGVTTAFFAAGRGTPVAWAAAALLTTGMAWSRVHLGAHRLDEVAAGAVIGAVIGAAAQNLAGQVDR